MSFSRYLEAKYTTACEMQRAIHRDTLMVAMLRNGPPTTDLVREWMRQYGLFQGITAQNRNAVVTRFLEFAEQHEQTDHEPNANQIEASYTELLSALYGTVARSWVSATSKLLWCLYPQTIAIYDRFVHRVLVVLQCIDEDLAGFPRIGATPQIDSEADIAPAVQHYMNYRAMVHRLRSVHQRLLSELRTRHNEVYPYDIRILDKVLENSRQGY